MYPPLLALGLSPIQIAILVFIGILLFGKRLPEVGRTLAKGIREFQDGMRGVESEVTGSITRDPDITTDTRPRPPQRITESAPKFVETDTTTASANTNDNQPMV